MEHWFDQLARGVADRRLSRRQVLVTGARAFAAGTVAGGGYALFSQRARAQATPCIPPDIMQNCLNIAAQTQADAEQACAAELAANQPACLAQAASSGYFAELQCVKDAQKNHNQCGACDHCGHDGFCAPDCPLLSCIKCDSSLLPDYPCVPTCPEDQYCDPETDKCQPKCTQPCAKQYDPSTGGCHDTCNEKDPCMECRQNTCLPICDTGCERCENGNCIDQCPAGKICCGKFPSKGGVRNGTCLTCRCGKCDNNTGRCTGDECPPARPTCCNDECVDLKSDSNNCGSCGHVCPHGEPCNAGQCGTNPCPPSTYVCGDVRTKWTCCATATNNGNPHYCYVCEGEPQCTEVESFCCGNFTCLSGTGSVCCPEQNICCDEGQTCCEPAAGGPCCDAS